MGGREVIVHIEMHELIALTHHKTTCSYQLTKERTDYSVEPRCSKYIN